MKPYVYLCALLVVGSVTTGCGDDTMTSPSPASSMRLTAALLPFNEVPPITGSEASGSGTAALTFNLTKDSTGNITAATLDVTVSATGFPPGTALTASHIHGGVAGVNGGILVSFGLAAGEVTFPNGSGSFTKQGVTMTIDQANSIVANPGAFYVNIHTAANPGGVARGQLTAVQ
jgi:CHRD domain-containing protein